MYLEILLGIFSGLRSGEVLGLKWSDIDFDEKSVSIRRQITRDYYILISTVSKVLGHSSEQTTYNVYLGII